MSAHFNGDVRFRIAERKLRFRAPVDFELCRFGHENHFHENTLRLFALGIENIVASAVERIHHLPVLEQNCVVRFGNDHARVGIEPVGTQFYEQFLVRSLISQNTAVFHR